MFAARKQDFRRRLDLGGGKGCPWVFFPDFFCFMGYRRLAPLGFGDCVIVQCISWLLFSTWVLSSFSPFLIILWHTWPLPSPCPSLGNTWALMQMNKWSKPAKDKRTINVTIGLVNFFSQNFVSGVNFFTPLSKSRTFSFCGLYSLTRSPERCILFLQP